MSENNLDTILEGLRSEEKLLSLELSALESKVTDVRTQLDKVLAGISGLTGDGGGRLGARRLNKGSGLTEPEVLSMLESILKEQGAMSLEDLKKKAGEAAKAQARSRSGLHLRVQGALKNGRFSETEGRWSVKKMATGEEDCSEADQGVPRVG